VRGDELRVVDAFVTWLESEGWAVRREFEFVDIIATRDGETLYAEAKGRTAAVGLDVDTMYGQLLRRMSDGSGSARYAVVVPSEAVTAALRVPAWVRRRLAVAVFEVAESGVVTLRP
jgi:hypothetical protein